MGHELIYREHPLLPRLAGHVRCVWELRGPCGGVAPQQILPDGCTELVVNFGGPVERLLGADVVQAASTFFLAEPRRPVTSRSLGPIALVGVRFWPGASRSFVDAPMAELVDGAFDDAVLVRPLARQIASAVHGADPDDRIRRLQLALVEQLNRAEPVDGLVRAAAGVLFAREGRVRIETLADDLGTSRRHLERRFVQETGLGPKSLAGVLRFRRVLRAIRTRTPDWATVARSCGYSDQSHLTRDFKGFTGQAPARWLRENHPAWVAGPDG